MKQKLDNKHPVTKEELSDALQTYPTKEDLKKELSNYATKHDLKKELSKHPTKDDFKKFDQKISKRLTDSQNSFRVEIKHEFSVMRAEFDEKFSKFANLILTAIDPLLKELETRREDREIGTAQTRRIEEDVENLKTRVSKLEHS